MFTTLRNAFKIKDLRNKILFTFAMLVVIRFGSQLPVPGVNGDFIQNWFAAQTGDAFSFFDAITGGSFMTMSADLTTFTADLGGTIVAGESTNADFVKVNGTFICMKANAEEEKNKKKALMQLLLTGIVRV